MSPKNEALTLLLALLITVGILGAGYWFFNRQSGFDRLPVRQAPSSPNAQSPPVPSAAQQPTAGSFAEVQSVPAGLFNYGGSTSWAPIRLSVDAVLQGARPEFRLRYVSPGSRPPSSAEGIRMLLNGEVAFVQSSRPLRDPEYSQAQQRGFRLQQIPVAIDGLAIAVHPNLKIPGLTLAQLRGIYTGQIRNWQQVGGPNLAIIPYSRPNAAGSTFDEQVMDGAALGNNVRRIATTTQAIRQLANTPGGIFYASAPELVPQCLITTVPLGKAAGQWVTPYQKPFVPLAQCPNRRNQVNVQAFQQGTYPLTRNLWVIVKQNGRIEEQAGNTYANLLLTAQGQALIRQASFVPVR